MEEKEGEMGDMGEGRRTLIITIPKVLPTRPRSALNQRAELIPHDVPRMQRHATYAAAELLVFFKRACLVVNCRALPLPSA